MNISMYTTYALEEQSFSCPQEAFRYFYNKGVRYGDILDMEPRLLPLHLYCEYLRDAGITPNSFVSTAKIASFYENERQYALATVKGVIDQLAKLQIPMLMLAPVVQPADNAEEWKKMQELLIESFAQMVGYAGDSGVLVCIENQSVVTRADSKIEDIRYILDCVPELGYVFDAGNFFCVAEDSLKAYEKLRDRLVHAHFKDWKYDAYGRGVRENMPRFAGVSLGQGELPLSELIRRMKQDGYAGSVMLEINCVKTITLDMLDTSLDFLRSEIDA